ncbi:MULTISPECIES: Ig-like domain-containing protein [unclassified Imperialibacter]|uniref:Ig-like domain-containing protein n=1 Tax=unclassified Imperialibacter TaxID=2629706 RepID=UPI0012586896|nr:MULTISPECIES: Ig-like domain-containing protein [unclassified Imperialibacter]CAD5281288.1 hypothetical protein IMPERIA89_50003 [Imperialibacter sp. 89]CAD5288310.1 hypothetical protein IMPERIA75_600283 [Imperialibacter sp. 75]VVT31322.1 hypothetical protein IMPR6_50285 [Imperialibacter sp. EC-SDR9]
MKTSAILFLRPLLAKYWLALFLFTLFNNSCYAFYQDTVKPIGTLSTSEPVPTTNQTFEVTAFFSEEVYFGLSGLDLTNCTASNLQTSDNQTFTFDVTALTQGLVSITIPFFSASDFAGNQLKANVLFNTEYNAPPVPYLFSTILDTNDNPFSLEMDFSEPLSELLTTDFTVTNGTVADVTLTAVATESVLGRVPTHVSAVTDIHFDRANKRILIAEASGHRVWVFNRAGQALFNFGSQGSGDGQFQQPFGVSTDSDGNIYVADKYNSRIQVFDDGGTFIRKFGSNGSGDGKLSAPWDLALDSDGNIYVNDLGNYRIQVFDNAGNFIRKFGSKGTGDGQLSSVRHMALDSDNNLYLADLATHKVHVFDDDGNFVRKFGTYGSGQGQLFSPKTIAINDAGEVLVGDSYSRVQVFDKEGNYRRVIATNMFSGAQGLTIDHKGRVLTGLNGWVYFYDLQEVDYTVSITPENEGAVTLTLPAGAVEDRDGTSNVVMVSTTAYYDSTPPEVTFSNNNIVTNDADFSFNIIFSEPVSLFGINDLLVTNGQVIAFSVVDERSYNLELKAIEEGELTVTVPENGGTDDAGNGNLEAIWKSTYDATPPSAEFSSANTISGAEHELVDVVFSEDVTGFDVSDLAVSNGFASDLQALSESAYRFLLTPDNEGEVSVSIPAGVASDQAGNENDSQSYSINFDFTGPELSAEAPVMVNGDFELTIEFSEEVVDFELTDVVAVNAEITAIASADNQIFTVTARPQDAGEVTFSVSSAIATDRAGNENAPLAEVVTVVYDNVAPTLMLKEASLVLDEGSAILTVLDVDDGSSDNMGAVTIVLGKTEFTCADVGENEVDVTVTDEAGNESVGSVAVSVTESNPPVAVARDIELVFGDEVELVVTVADLDAGSSDDCGISSIGVDKTRFTVADLGKNSVVFTVTDKSGNSASTEVTIAIKKRLKASIEPVSIRYGDMVPPIDIHYEGFVGEDTEAVLDEAPSVYTEAAQGSVPNTYQIELEGGSDDEYLIELSSADLTVEKAPLTIQANDEERVYGEENPVFLLHYDGFVLSEDESVVEPPTASTEATPDSDTGIYSITLSGGKAENYEITLKDGSLTVNKARAAILITGLEQETDNKPKEVTVTTDPANLPYEITYNGDVDVPVQAGSYQVMVVVTSTNYEGEAEAVLILNDPVMAVAETLLADGVKIYPNPVADYVTVDLGNTGLNAGMIRLFDLKGYEILRDRFYGQQHLLNLQRQVSGLYLLVVTDEEGRLLKRVKVRKE